MKQVMWATTAFVVSLAFLSTYFLTPKLIEVFKKNAITGTDVHKLERPERAEMCGLGAVVGFAGALSVAVLLMPLDRVILGVVLSVVSASLVGVLDDLYGLRQRHKVLLLFVAAVPLSLALRSHTTLAVPLLGAVDFGIMFPLVLVPIGISGASNLTNMLAGFNGLEAGIGGVALGAVALSGLVMGNFACFLIGTTMAAALGAFLVYNWYPAKAFPGDAGTLAIGACLACAVIVGEIEFLGVLLLLPHILDFVMKSFSGRKQGKPFGQRMVYGDTKVSNDGILQPPPYLSVPHLVMKAMPVTERGLVWVLLLFEGLVGVAAVLISSWVM